MEGVTDAPTAPKAEPAPLLVARGLERASGRDGGAFGPVDLEAPGGSLVGVVGPNGAGKTSLLRALAGLLAVDAGTVRVRGDDLRALAAARRARCVAWVPQRDAVCEGWSVRAWVAQARAPYTGWTGALRANDEGAVDGAMRVWDLAALADRDVATLSGGELRRCALARAFAQETPVMLLDEPLASLDLGQQLGFATRLRGWLRPDRAAVMVVHDLAFAARWCDALVLLADGRVRGAGLPSDVLRSEPLSEAFGVPLRVRRGPEGVVAVDAVEG